MRVAVELAVVLGGCFAPPSGYTVCDNDAICPSGLACTETDALCGLPGDVSACKGMPDRTGCFGTTHSIGSCKENVCDACDPNWVECRYASWTPMTSGVNAPIKAVWARSPSDAYAVSGTTVLHYNGTSWALQHDLGSPLVSVWGRETGEVFALEYRGQIFRDGQLDTMPPASTPMFGIFGVSNEVIAVGQTEVTGVLGATGWSWWSPVFDNLYAVWGTGNDTFAVGEGVVKRRNGTTWQSYPAPNATDILNAIWGVSASDFFVVGQLSAVGVIHHRTTTWTPATLSEPVGTLTAIWGTSENDVYAVGVRGTILHFDGTAWTKMPTPDATVDLQGVWGSGNDVFAVGANGAIWKYSHP